MVEDKTSGIREGEEIFLSYLDDNEKIVSGYFILLKLSEALIQIKSNQNVIVIPISRLVKIKQRCN
ncbi:MAG: hypothetical protein WC979_05400 [Candidatus Pacearchaeota archaeon]|jgi:hypothetical protein